MRVLIWGVTPLAKYISTHLIEINRRIKPFAYIDNAPKFHGNCIEGIPVISYDSLVKMDDMEEVTILLAVRNSINIIEILEQLKGVPVANIGIVKPRVMLSDELIDIYKEDGEIVWSRFGTQNYRIIPRIEINMIDGCNLKCKGCTHFSSIFKEDSIYPLADYKKNLLRLKEIGKIFRLRLLGGEPFLIKNLDEYLSVTREVLGETDIELISNGLLIPDADEKVMKAIQQKKIRVGISQYPPTIKKKDKIVEKLADYNILWYFEGEKVEYFSRSLTLQNTHNSQISNKACMSSTCTFLRKGKLYKCPFEGIIQDFFDYYELDWDMQCGKDIYDDKDIVYKKILTYILQPVEMCKYCAERPEYIPWSVKSNPNLNDWLYKEGQE